MWCRVPETPTNKKKRMIHYAFNGKVNCSCLPLVRSSIESLELVPEEEILPKAVCRDCLFLMIARNMKGITWERAMLSKQEYKSIVRVRRDYEFLTYLLPQIHKKFSASH